MEHEIAKGKDRAKQSEFEERVEALVTQESRYLLLARATTGDAGGTLG